MCECTGDFRNITVHHSRLVTHVVNDQNIKNNDLKTKTNYLKEKNM